MLFLALTHQKQHRTRKSTTLPQAKKLRAKVLKNDTSLFSVFSIAQLVCVFLLTAFTALESNNKHVSGI